MNAMETRKHIRSLLDWIELCTGRTQAPEIKRSCSRYTWIAPGTVEFDGTKDSSEPLYITTRNISGQSLGFRSPCMLQPSSKVFINLQTHEGQLRIPATVVHSTPSVGMPIIGVSFNLD